MNTTQKQLTTLAHLECTVSNFVKGQTTPLKLQGAVRRCVRANVSRSIINRAIARELKQS